MISLFSPLKNLRYSSAILSSCSGGPIGSPSTFFTYSGAMVPTRRRTNGFKRGGTNLSISLTPTSFRFRGSFFIESFLLPAVNPHYTRKTERCEINKLQEQVYSLFIQFSAIVKK